MTRRLFAIFALFLFQATTLLAFTDGEGFRYPVPGTPLPFPETHGSHPDFRIEWWYLTGHLYATNGNRYGFQATFFRNAAPREDQLPRNADPQFGDSDLHMAHMSLSNINAQSFHYEERLQRNGWDAFATPGHLHLRNGNWTLEMTDPETETMRLRGSIHADIRFDLQLVPAKPRVRFGEDGISRKGAGEGAASYYITFTRLTTQGKLVISGDSIPVTGETWMDHEIASKQLSDDLTGWDWTAIQLNDGREIKAYRLRRKDGSADRFSALYWIDENGETLQADPASFTWIDRSFWESPKSGGKYPIRVEIRTTDPQTGQSVSLFLEPLLEQQELGGDLTSIAYWEGACNVLDNNRKIIGNAFLELTGYASSLSGRL